MAPKVRKILVELDPEPSGLFPGSDLTLNVSITQDDKAISGKTSSKKKLTVGCPSFEPETFELSLRSSGKKKLKLKPLATGYSFDPKPVIDLALVDPKNDPGEENVYKYEWTGLKTGDEVEIKQPVATLTTDPAGGSLSAGGTVTVKVAVDHPSTDDVPLKLSGDALVEETTLTIAGGEASVEHEAAVIETAGAGKTIKVIDLDPMFKAPGDKTGFDVKDWKLSFDGDPAPAVDHGGKIHRNDTLKLNVKLEQEAEVDEQFTIQLLKAEDSSSIYEAEDASYKVAKDSKEVEVEFFVDAGKFTTPANKAEDVILKLNPTEGKGKGLELGEDGQKAVTLEPFLVSFQDESAAAITKVDPDHGKDGDTPILIQGDTVKVKIGADYAPPEPFVVGVQFSVTDGDGSYFCNRWVTFPKDATEQELEFKLEGKGGNNLVKDQPVYLALVFTKTRQKVDGEGKVVEAEDGLAPSAMVACGGKTVDDLVIKALPRITFHEGSPIPGRSLYNHEKKGEQDYFRLAAGLKHTIVVKRSYAAPGMETKATVSGRNLKAPVEVDFSASLLDGSPAPDVTEYTEDAAEHLERKVEIELKDKDQNNAYPITLAAAAGSSLVPAHAETTPTTLKVRRSQPHLSFGDGWTFPASLPLAPGDQAWLRLERTGPDLGEECEVVGTIACDAFVENPYDGPLQGARKYPLAFLKATPEMSLDACGKYEKIKLDDLTFDAGAPAPDAAAGELAGIRIRPFDVGEGAEFTSGSHEVTVEITATNAGGKPLYTVKGAVPRLEVRNRYAFISNPPNLDNVKVGDTVSATVALSHPARTNTAVLVTSNGATKKHYVGFYVGQDQMTFDVEIDKAPPDGESLRLEVEPYAGNVTTAGAEEVASYPPAIERSATYVGLSKEEPFKEKPYESGDPALPTFGKGSKATLVVRLSQSAVTETAAEVVGLDIFPPNDENLSIYIVDFAAGEVEKEIEVEFVNEAPSGTKIVVRPKWEGNGMLTAVSEGDAERGATSLLGEVSVAIDNPPTCVFGQWEDVAVADGEDPRQELNEEAWVDPAGGETEPREGASQGRKLPPNFVVEEKAKIFIALQSEAIEERKGLLVSPVIDGGKIEFTIPAGEREPDGKSIEVEMVAEDLAITKEYFGRKRSKPRWGNHPIVIRPIPAGEEEGAELVPTVTPGSEEKSFWVFEKRRVFFDQEHPTFPDGPFVQDDQASVHIQLDVPAPVAGAKAKVTGPFEPVEIEIPHGHYTGSSSVKFNADCEIADKKLEVLEIENCVVDKGNKAGVLVKTPEVEFDTEEWGESTLVLGTTVRLPFLMKGLCPQETPPAEEGHPPIRGAVLAVECDLFLERSPDLGNATEKTLVAGKTKAYPVQFVEEQNRDGENRAWVDVPISLEAPDGSTDPEGTIDLSLTTSDLKIRWIGGLLEEDKDLAPRCTVAAGKETEEVKWSVPPSVIFEETGGVQYSKADESEKLLVMNPGPEELDPASQPAPPDETNLRAWVMDALKPAEGVAFKVGDTTALSLKTSQKVPDDLTVRVSGPALGPKPKIVVLPKESDTPVSVELTFAAGRSTKSGDVGGEEKKFVVPHVIEARVVDPPGYISDPVHGELSVAVWNETGCPPEHEMRLIRSVEPLDVEDQQVPEEPCNLKRMLVKVVHGEKIQGAEGPEEPGGDIRLPERGPYGDGTFEVVSDVTAAEHGSQALVCSGSRVPVLQVTGGHTSPDPHFGGEQEESLHFAQIAIGFEREGEDEGTLERCAIAYDLYGQVYSHPFVFVADRCLKSSDMVERASLGDEFPVETVGKVIMPASYLDPEEPPPLTMVRREGTERYRWAPLHPHGDPDYNTMTNVLTLPVYRGHRNADYQVEIEEEEPADSGKKKKRKKKRKKRSALATWLRDVRSALTSGRDNTKPQQYLIEARSCGYPDPEGDCEHGPVKRLQAIVEVYPADEYCLFIGSQASPSVMGQLEEGKFLSGDKGFDPNKGFEPLDDVIRPAEQIQAATAGFYAAEVEVAPPTPDFVEKYKDAQTDYMTTEPANLQKEVREEEELKAIDAAIAATDPGGGQPVLAPVEPEDAQREMYKFFSKIEPGSLDGTFTLTPPTRVLYPYTGPDSRVSVSWKPDPNASGNMENRPMDGVTEDKGLDTLYGSGALSLVSDVNIHIGRNGSGIDPETNNEIRNSLKAIIDAFVVVLDALNKSGGTGAAYGFGFTFALSFLQGHYVRYWGWKETDDQRVFWWNSNSIDMKLVGVQMELLFGVAYHMVIYKFEAVIFGQLALDAYVKRDFEKVAPTDSTGNWVDKHLDFVTTAKIGVRIVVGRPEYLSFEAAVKTGYTLRFRADSESQAEIEVYFNGLSVYCEVHILGLFHPKAEKVLIKGNVVGWPTAMITLGHKREKKMLYVDREINKGLSRLRYIRGTYLAHLQKYQELQVAIVSAKKVASGQKYPLTCALPGYRFMETEHLEQSDWNQNKELWDQQWKDVKRYFQFEDHMVSRRRPGKKQKLADRLKRKEEETERLFNDVFIPKLERLDKLEEKFERLQGQVSRAKERYGENNIPEDAQSRYWHTAEYLTFNDDLNYRKISGDSRWKNQIKELEMQLKGLKYYALKRRKW